MTEVMQVGDITAISNRQQGGSEVLLFKRHEGLLGRVVLREKGSALEQRLQRSFQRVLFGEALEQQ
jgi:hypothetical protein